MLRLLKISIAVVFINKLINICLAEPPDIHLDNVNFVVGIFEDNPVDPGRLKYLGQGVLVNHKTVLTASINLFEDMELRIRIYVWSKTSNNDFQSSNLKFYERTVQNIMIFDEAPEIAALYLEKPVNGIIFIWERNYDTFDTHNTNNECALVKFKLNKAFTKIQVKQRRVKPLGNFKERGCSENTVSKISDFYSSDVKNYFCALETGKKNCHTQAGAALVCESRQNPGQYYLAGINILKDNCELMFANTQILINSIYRKKKGRGQSSSPEEVGNVEAKLPNSPFFQFLH
ncbi:uncharacterized protein LOC130664482 [Microplitis mediator]|uniref:uncharacterized protein LOC130664482 n=1 Tax=Microplitis mediator TaxID=375433 RepID=UPI002554F34B|nr:uncharacterized protein LOC130664482 [Microplitis mediator]